MTCSLTDFDQICDVLTENPDRRMGPMQLRAAVRSISIHRPLAEAVAIELSDGTRLDELEIEALHTIASGTLFNGPAMPHPTDARLDRKAAAVAHSPG